MKIQIKNSTKRTYKVPKIEKLKLDNEISLVLESSPPKGPYEAQYIQNTSDYYNNDPFKTNVD